MGYDLEDTICAIASPPGGAARGIIRISGPTALPHVRAQFRAGSPAAALPEQSPTAVDGTWRLEPCGRSLPCRVLMWPGERSYTRQPTAELHLPGSRPLLQRVLEQLCGRPEVRLAEPGEFTLRAFLAGRLDLTQAEAVLGVIDAKSSRQLQTALRQLAGGLSGPLSALRDQLLNVCADLEAGLDFVDEDIEFISSAEVARQLQSAHSVMTSLLENLATRRRQDQEPTIALRGSPNVGKSTLWNALLGHNEAIVSPIPGTTRDYLTGRADLGGMMCTLLDSAGIDPRLNSPIDHTSQQLADQLHREVDLVVLCLDSSRAMTDWERHELQTGTADLVVATKADRQQHEAFLADVREQFPSVTSACLVASRQAPGQRPQPAPPLLGISAVTGQGMSELRAALQSLLERRLAEESTLVSSTAARCQIQLRQATEAIERALGLALVSEGHELIAAELRETLTHLGQIVGAIYTDDILDRVFSRFCIGK